ncbi:MAG: exopolyphosphatase [Corynebacterium sp.]|nr:exopolyphosphatase [Corynebacterium sp.]
MTNVRNDSAAPYAGDDDATARTYYVGDNYDPETVRFFDVAHEGAQARSLKDSAADISSRVHGLSPRAIVVVALDHVAHAAAEFVTHKMAPLHQPLVVVDELPKFVGPLDIVVVVGERADSDLALYGLITANRRGATTIVLGPGRGQLIEEAPEESLVIPTLPTAEGPSPVRYIAGLHMILWALDHDLAVVERRLEEIANAVDDELLALSPERDASVNPGRKLREFCQGARVIHSAQCRYVPVDYQPREINIGPLVAQFAATLWAARGIGGEYVASEELGFALERQRHDQEISTGGVPAVDDLFFDPFLDEEERSRGHVVPLKIVMWGSGETDIAGCIAADVVHTETLVSAPSGVSELIRALRLITRAFAVTTYEIA